MQLEAIGRVSMSDLSLEIGGQVDDIDGTKRTFLRTDTAADTETFGYEGDFGFWGDFDAQLAGPHDRT